MCIRDSRSPSGIVALAERPADRRGDIYTPARPLVIVAHSVQDPGNVGALVRVAEAAGASGVVTTGECADPFGWKALRGSMGSALRVPIGREQAAEDAVAEARRHGCAIVVTVPRGGRSLFETDFTRPIAVVIGGEGAGVPPSVAEAADERVSIPMAPPVE